MHISVIGQFKNIPNSRICKYFCCIQRLFYRHIVFAAFFDLSEWQRSHVCTHMPPNFPPDFPNHFARPLFRAAAKVNNVPHNKATLSALFSQPAPPLFWAAARFHYHFLFNYQCSQMLRLFSLLLLLFLFSFFFMVNRVALKSVASFLVAFEVHVCSALWLCCLLNSLSSRMLIEFCSSWKTYGKSKDLPVIDSICQLSLSKKAKKD